MSDELQAFEDTLPGLLLISVPMIFLLSALHRDSIPFLRFRSPAGSTEPALWGLGEVLLCFATWFMAQIVVSVVVQPLVAQGALGRSASLFLETAVCTSVLCVLCVRLVAGLLGQPLSTLGLKRGTVSNAAPVVALYLLLLIPLEALHRLWNLGLHQFLGVDPAPQPAVDLFRTAVTSGDTASVACLVIAGVVLAPIGEELLFRGVIFGWMKSRWGAWPGAVISALFFAVIHLSLSSAAPLFVLGLVLVYVYERTGSLYFSMLFHSVFNGVAFASILLSRHG